MVKISIEHIQKINNLVQELLRRGICSTRDEAVKMAEKYLDKKIISGKTEALGPEPNQASQNTSSSDIDSLRNMIERAKEYTQKDLQKFRDALEVLAKEVDKLKKQVNDLKIAGESKSVQNTELEGKSVKEAIEKQEKLPEKKKKDKGFHPKQGRLKSEDVSVEKMFYYGNK